MFANKHLFHRSLSRGIHETLSLAHAYVHTHTYIPYARSHTSRAFIDEINSGYSGIVSSLLFLERPESNIRLFDFVDDAIPSVFRGQVRCVCGLLNSLLVSLVTVIRFNSSFVASVEFGGVSPKTARSLFHGYAKNTLYSISRCSTHAYSTHHARVRYTRVVIHMYIFIYVYV